MIHVSNSMLLEVFDQVGIGFVSSSDIVRMVGKVGSQAVSCFSHILHQAFLAFDQVNAVSSGQQDVPW